MNMMQRIITFNKGRNPTFLAIKYKALTESPFRFFRGTCHLFYEDLIKKIPFKDPTKSWICGDLHLENFGTYKGGNGLVYFDLDDFDEAVRAPISWEVLRMLTSIHVAVDALNVGIDYGNKLAECFFKRYQKIILTGKPIAFERETTTGLIRSFITKVEKRKLKTLLAERTTVGEGGATIRIIDNKTLAITNKRLKDKVMQAVSSWCKQNNLGDWEICDVTYRIAGTGSLGVDRFVILIHNTRLRKFSLLDMKEALPCSLQPYLKLKKPIWKNNAERVVTVQHFMQNVTPSILSTIACNNKMFVIKKLQPQEDAMNLAVCHGKIKKLEEVMNAFAEITASAHLRACGRQGSSTIDDLIAFFKTADIWQHKLLAYGKNYAGRVKKDWEKYCKEMDAEKLNNNPPVLPKATRI